MDTSDIVQAEVARFLTTPGLLNKSKEIDQLFESDQIQELRYFRGFITKVMHNGIRKYIPQTMAALNILQIELEFYLAVSPDYQRLRAQGPIPSEIHLRWYENALNEWVSNEIVEGGTLIQDILAHELVQHHARQINRSAKTHYEKNAVSIGAEVVLRRYSHDLQTALRDLKSGTLDPARTLLKNPMNLAYCLKTNGIHVLIEVDALTARALSLIDGKRTISDMVSCFATHGLQDVDKEMLSNIFARVVSQISQNSEV